MKHGVHASITLFVVTGGDVREARDQLGGHWHSAVETAVRVKCLMPKHQDLSLDSQHLLVGNLSTEDMKTGGPGAVCLVILHE